MRVAAVISDLLLYSRIEGAASAAGASVIRGDTPAELPSDLDLVLVDWSAHQPAWPDALRVISASGTRVILFGPHTDLEAHTAARDAGLGPMMARSKLVSDLPRLLGGRGAG